MRRIFHFAYQHLYITHINWIDRDFHRARFARGEIGQQVFSDTASVMNVSPDSKGRAHAGNLLQDMIRTMDGSKGNSLPPKTHVVLTDNH